MLTLWATVGIITLFAFESLADEYKENQRLRLMGSMEQPIMEESEG
jgi:hypothetical protein